jgi:hypothetical protein
MPHPTQNVAVRDGYGGLVTLNPAINYADNDPLVLAFPQFFSSRDLPKGTVVEDGVVVEVTQPRAPRKAPGKRTATRG